MNDLFSWVLLILAAVPILALLSQPAIYQVSDHPPRWWHPLRNIVLNGAALVVTALILGYAFTLMSKAFNL